MQRYKCTISYDGTGFVGYQVQPNGRTVQSELEMALSRLHKGIKIKAFASGRTDAGVHAKGQVVHFDSSLEIPLSKWQVALNATLPGDISILKVEKAESDFHARFDAVGKEYRYFLQISSLRDPFTRNYAYQYPYPIDLDLMKAAARQLIGTYDFTSFCSAKTVLEDKIRTLREIDIVLKEDELSFRFVGNGFLYNMVRILVGTLLEVGTGRRTPDSIPFILNGKDRSLAGKTAPAHGLYLWKVFY